MSNKCKFLQSKNNSTHVWNKQNTYTSAQREQMLGNGSFWCELDWKFQPTKKFLGEGEKKKHDCESVE